MEGDTLIYDAEYSNSWALVIGINKYKYVNPLGFACNDATVISRLLVEQFDFPEENVTLILDEEATKSNIMSRFLSYANGNTEANDRVIIFYAGHGHTISGRRGENGYLIPYDGDTGDISTFIRWDELTRNSDLIRAKHMLFVMDACYGGLAITRALQSGSTRFLKDMHRRYSRQVLTAGKADEVVADANGPIAGHSIFTGHFIQGLLGEAAKTDGIITANGVMSYVYEKVSKDIYSNQSPHYGYYDGDGDFIFKAPILASLTDDKVDEDKMIVIPGVYDESNKSEETMLIDKTKEFLSEDRHHIKLDDLINRELRQTMAQFDEKFSVQGSFSPEEFLSRLKSYEKIIENISAILTSISHWGNHNNISSVRKIISRLSEQNVMGAGLVIWLKLRWYPQLLLLYSGGISAIASGKYDMLAALLTTNVQNERRSRTQEVIVTTLSELSEVVDVFKHIPGHERNRVPRSEYLFKLLQPKIDDLLFLGKSYESIFDRFEVLSSLVYADINDPEGIHIWGPPGRFSWKHFSDEMNPLQTVIKEAETLKNEWPPIKAGLFGGSYERFEKLSVKYLEAVSKLNWY